jgi:hypothetical protein
MLHDQLIQGLHVVKTSLRHQLRHTPKGWQTVAGSPRLSVHTMNKNPMTNARKVRHWVNDHSGLSV